MTQVINTKSPFYNYTHDIIFGSLNTNDHIYRQTWCYFRSIEHQRAYLSTNVMLFSVHWTLTILFNDTHDVIFGSLNTNDHISSYTHDVIFGSLNTEDHISTIIHMMLFSVHWTLTIIFNDTHMMLFSVQWTLTITISTMIHRVQLATIKFLEHILNANNSLVNKVYSSTEQ